MSEKARAYYSSAADDEITMRENHTAYHRFALFGVSFSFCCLIIVSCDSIWFRPRVLRDVTSVDFSTTILGQKSSMPIYIVSLLHIMTSLNFITLLECHSSRQTRTP